MAATGTVDCSAPPADTPASMVSWCSPSWLAAVLLSAALPSVLVAADGVAVAAAPVAAVAPVTAGVTSSAAPGSATVAPADPYFPTWSPMGEVPPERLPGIPPELPFFKAVQRSGATAPGTSLDWTSPESSMTFGGGRRGRFQGLTLSADSLTVHLGTVTVAATAAVTGGAASNVPSTLTAFDLIPGPLGPEDGHVHLDSREAMDPEFGFRGRLYPRQASMHLREVVPPAGGNRPALLRYDLELSDLGSFAGLLRGEDDRWFYLQGHAVRGVVTLVADLDPTARMHLGNPRLEEILISGSDHEDVVVQRGRDDGQPMPSDDARLPLARVQGQWRGSWLRFHFDAQGRYHHTTTSDDGTFFGDKALFILPDGR